MSPSNGRVFLIGCGGYPFAVVVHGLSGLLFWELGYDVLALWEVAATAMWFIFWLLVLTRRAFKAAIIVPLLFEIPLRAALATYYTGIATAFWAFPIISLLILPMSDLFSKRTKVLLVLYLLTAIAAIVSLPAILPTVAPLSTGWELFFLIGNVLSVATIVVVVVSLFQIVVVRAEEALENEFNRAEGLLQNILPAPIALRLKDGEHLIADDYAEATVLFADIVNFTDASAKLSPAELVETLNLVFTEFDQLAAKHGAEKIKTIGDAYMAVVGVPDHQDAHAAVAVDMALDMLKAASRVSAKTHFPIDIRIGINSGPVVAGVIGETKFAYDLWGDAVNVASRMESHGEPGIILMTQATQDLLPPALSGRSAGTRSVKGKGEMQVFALAGASSSA